jgi:hypothetical protein
LRTRWVGDKLAQPLEDAQSWLEDNLPADDMIDERMRAMLIVYAAKPGAFVSRMMDLRPRRAPRSRH